MKFPIGSPLKVQGLLKPAMDFGGLNMKFYLTTSLEPEIYLLAGKIYVKASGKIGVDPFAAGNAPDKDSDSFDTGGSPTIFRVIICDLKQISK